MASNDDLDFDFGLGRFQSITEQLEGEEKERADLVARMLPYHVSFLDDALGGILPHDLIVLGARTGAGKTELATIIAQENARLGRRIHYFALEGEPREIARRLEYRLIAQHLYDSQTYVPGGISYDRWYRGKLDEYVGTFGQEAEREAKQLKTLKAYYRGRDFDGAELERLLLAIQHETDLIVLDHLHYVDIPDDNENRGTKMLVKRIRDAALSMGKPVILVAHLRKRQVGGRLALPDIDDFHGTSDIVKIATRVIVLGREAGEVGAGGQWRTLIHVAKNRMNGEVTRHVARVTFDISRGTYAYPYELGRMKGEKFEPLESRELPYWARKEQ